MKKMQPLAIALFALASVSGAATTLNSSGSMQKQPETDATNLNSSRSNIYRVKVTKVDEKNKTFAVEVTFSAAKPKPVPTPRPPSGTPAGTGIATQESRSAVGDVIDVIYTPNPTGEPPAAAYNTSKSNSFRLKAGQSGLTGKVLSVNERNKTFTVEVTFSAKKLKSCWCPTPMCCPEVGKLYDITFTGPTTPGGPLEATTIQGSKSSASSF